MSRRAREQMEQDLKAGRLKAGWPKAGRPKAGRPEAGRPKARLDCEARRALWDAVHHAVRVSGLQAESDRFVQPTSGAEFYPVWYGAVRISRSGTRTGPRDRSRGPRDRSRGPPRNS